MPAVPSLSRGDLARTKRGLAGRLGRLGKISRAVGGQEAELEFGALPRGENSRNKISRIEPLNRSSRREEAHSIWVAGYLSHLTSSATASMGSERFQNLDVNRTLSVFHASGFAGGR